MVAEMATKKALFNLAGEYNVSVEVYSTLVEVYTDLKAIQSSPDSICIISSSIQGSG